MKTMQPLFEKRKNALSRKEPEPIYGVYTASVLTMKIGLGITEIGANIKQNLESKISKMTEGRCIKEGFIRPGSVSVLQYSAGNVNGDLVEFQTIYKCMICHPVEGMLLECNVKTITKAGIHAEVVDDRGTVPVTVFVARDHHMNDHAFAEVKEADKITVNVLGVRFELNDSYICVIAKRVNATRT